MLQFANTMAAGGISKAIGDAIWIIPAVQCVHILAISLVMGSVLMTNLRVLDLAGRSQSMAATARRFMPWLWWSLLVALLTGVVMIVGEPVRELVNPAFWAKMGLLTACLIGVVAFQATLSRGVEFWQRSARERRSSRVYAVLSMAMWVGIIVLGRWIAYAQTQT